jgi:hypothetical protein
VACPDLVAAVGQSDRVALDVPTVLANAGVSSVVAVFTAGTVARRKDRADRDLAARNAWRQTVIDVFCAYLRMPYTSPMMSQPRITGTTPHWSDAAIDGHCAETRPAQELQVRQTVQRLLFDHLRRPHTPRRKTLSGFREPKTRVPRPSPRPLTRPRTAGALPEERGTCICPPEQSGSRP